MKYDLFNKSLVKEFAINIRLSSEEKEKKLVILKEYIKRVRNKEFKDEVRNYKFFLMWILPKLLDYDIDDIEFENPIKGTRKRVEFALKDDDGNIFTIIEVKGQGTDLDKKQTGSEKTPVEQAVDYAFHEEVKWFIVTDYNEYRLYNIGKGDEYFSLNISELEDEELFKEFLLLFSKKSYQNGVVNDLLTKSIFKEIEFENEFYKFYHETRLMLIQELKTQNSLENKDAINIAQKILNRFMFIFFAEDRGLLPSRISAKTISSPINSSVLRGNSIWNSINKLFLEINDNEDCEITGIFPYNGGLFRDNLKDVKIRDKVESMDYLYDEKQECQINKLGVNIGDIERLLEPYGEVVNPIFKNLIAISTLDFSSELDVDILGHIFENSIEDIEKLKEGTDTRRNDDAIFYTKEYITDYICRNTIISYLSKSGDANTVSKLINEYSNVNEIEDLYNKLYKIKILDPSCGSGAFLNKSADILMEIHKAIHDFRKEQSVISIETKGGKGKGKIKRQAKHYIIDSFRGIVKERKDILEYNLFGVDLNEESVEITKLSLFLSIFKRDKDEYGKIEKIKLPNIDNNIQCGNSIIEDEAIAGKNAFNWGDKFDEILDNEGFDVIVGNPPWGAELSESELSYLKTKNKPIVVRMIDSFMYFVYEFSLKLRDKGYFGMIIPDVILYQSNNLKLRQHIFKNYSISRIINLGNGIFDNVNRPCCILIFKNQENNSLTKVTDFPKFPSKYIEFDINDERRYEEYNQNLIERIPGNLFVTNTIKNYEILKRIQNHCNEFTLEEVMDEDKISRGASPDLKEAFIVNKDIISKFNLEDSKLKRVVFGGKQVNRYYIDYQGHYLIYTTKKDDFSKLPHICSYIDTFKDEITCSEVIQNKHPIYSLHRPRKECIYTKDSKIIGVITEDEIIVTIDNEKLFATDGLYLFGTNKNYDPLYVIAILNSILYIFIYRLYCMENGRMMAQVKTTILKTIPIYPANQEEQKFFIDNAKLLIKLKKEFFEEINAFKNKLNDLYDINISSELINYYKLSNKEFITIIKSQKTYSELEKIYKPLISSFEKSREILLRKNHDMEHINQNINLEVFKLYGLSKDDLKQILEDAN
jgi:type I restriction-modification system DNA methylase subunit